MEEVDYKKKIKRCEKLGADKFQKVVFVVEQLKFKIIKKCFPNFIKRYDKSCDKKRDRALKKATTEEERKSIINYYRNQKMMVRKEFNREQNRNYHIDPNKPTEMLHYLNWNKKVHKKGMVKNAILIPVFGVASALGVWPAIPLLAMEVGSLFINFQCVNIQNCNIYRYKEKEEAMKRLEERRTKKNIAEYREAASVVSKVMEETEDIPSLSKIIDRVQTKEEAEQLKALIQNTLAANQQARAQNKANLGGGKK